jgi:perosamine synthetase
VQLERLPEIIATRRAIADRYRKLLADVPGLVLPHEPAWARSNWQSFCVRLPSHCEQRTVMQAMLDDGVSTRRGIMCSHRELPYAETRLPSPLPASEAAQDQCVILPLYPHLEAEQIEQVVSSLREACAAPRRASG